MCWAGFIFGHESQFFSFGIQSIHILGHLQASAVVAEDGANCIGQRVSWVERVDSTRGDERKRV